MTLKTKNQEKRPPYTYTPYTVESAQLDKFLDLKFGASVKDYLPGVLLRPIHDMMKRPRKNIRGRLVEIGYDLAAPEQKTDGKRRKVLTALNQAIELLHSGSLAVDDLQDGSKMRRGQPTLHLQYGLPLALNTGNWLYFWPLEMIHDLNLSSRVELELYRLYHRTLLRAHVGQALDVGLSMERIPQKKVMGLCLSTIELKSGALFSLALLSGALTFRFPV